MAECLTRDEVETVAAGRTARHDEHLAGCEACRAAVRVAFEAASNGSVTESASGTASTSADETFVVAPPSGRYRFPASAELGRGGFGKVLLAEDQSVGRKVAMKVLSSRARAQPHGTAELRLLREARVMAQLEHPAIVPLYELGRDEHGALYYTMRRIRGRTLAQAVREQPTLEDRLRLLPHVLTACHAIAYAHSRGVVHRDLKPQNVMLDSFGATYVIDWGLARAGETPDVSPGVDDAQPLTLVADDITTSHGDGRLGTRAYMSPEGLAGRRDLLDERADVWGLGALLFEVLTGKAPRDRHDRFDPTTVLTLEPDVPPDLAAICAKACAEARAQRFASAEALARDLDAWLHGRRVSAHEYRPGELAGRFMREHRRALLVGAAALVALVAGGSLSFQRVRAERNQARAFAHVIIGQVLERLSETRDADFADQLAATVTSWLPTTGQQGDASEAAWGWFLVARDAEATRGVPAELVDRCLRAATAAGQGVVAQAASLGCRVMKASPIGDDQFSPANVAELHRMEAEAPPPGAEDDFHWLTARALLLMRLGKFSTNHDELVSARRYSDAVLVLLRKLVVSEPNKSHALGLLSFALLARASNASRGVEAIALSEEALAAARGAVEARRDASTLAMLALALESYAEILRWHERDAGTGGPALRVKMLTEARRIDEALHVVSPEDDRVTQELTMIDLETADAAAAWEVISSLNFESAAPRQRTLFVFSALAASKPEAIVRREAQIGAGHEFDEKLALGLALASAGRLADGARTLRTAAAMTFSTAWSPPAMTAWAAPIAPPLGPPLREFVEALNVADRDDDTPAARAAIERFARDLEGLATLR
jgi:hypothetical protein